MMTTNLQRGVSRAVAVSGALLMLAGLAIPQSAEAQYGQGRYGQNGYGNGQGRYGNQGRYNRDRRDALTYNDIDFDWDLNGFNVRDRGRVESQIRQALNSNAMGGRNLTRQSGSRGVLEVNFKFSRVNRDTVKVESRIGLNQNGSGAAGLTATESATTRSTDRNVDPQFVLEAFNRARREFNTKLPDFARDERRNDRNDRYDRYDRNNR